MFKNTSDMKKKITLCCLLLVSLFVKADEGMWLPILLKSIEGDMQNQGFKLTAEDIYSINKSSMKDAVCLFGGGCTAELVSNQGLLLTNHHCGFEQIQEHSTVEHDYITNGFWAKNKTEELQNPSLSVTFIVRMEDVTAKILEGVTAKMGEKERTERIKANIQKVSAETEKGEGQAVVIRPFYYGNEFYLFVTKTYKDVRLVGAPPQSIGNFGGDTDNWVWPRHTADFSVFRIYTAPDGKPADFSDKNIPYKPDYFFPVSIKGVEENDFTMVYGFPGRTQEYISSYAVDYTMNVDDPTRITIRDARLAIIKDEMEKNDTVRIQYAAKKAGIANGWKKWKGEVKGLKKTNAIAKKQAYEADFVNKSKEMGKPYAQYLTDLKNIYQSYTPLKREQVYFSEVYNGLECVQLAKGLQAALASPTPAIENARQTAKDFFKEYSATIDKRAMAALLDIYAKNIPTHRQPEVIRTAALNYKGDWNKYAEEVFAKSMFTNLKRFQAAMDKFDVKVMEKDPVYLLANGMTTWYGTQVQPIVVMRESSIDSLNRLYMKAQREVMTDKKFYPDANSTLRITYGKVEGFSPDDGVKYVFYTTLDGVMEKNANEPTNTDYVVSERLKYLHLRQDYGPYADKSGKMRTCFLASNHTSGGNSGSPVLNAKGELIGINFDRCWESTMSDINYDVSLCRNITADIRYVLFVIDKFAEAKYLVDEMTIVK